MKRELIDVIFRMSVTSDGCESECVAFFPGLLGTYEPHTCTTYVHVGQHGSGSRDWYWLTRPATRKEYAPLLRELRGIYERALGPGDPVYRLNVVKRWTRKHDSARMADAARYARKVTP